MCGVFGFVGRDNQPVNLKWLERIARATERRGQDAFGFAWIDGRGRLKCYKQTGKITNHLGLLAMARDARMLIGHCRWATQGDPLNNLNNHPHAADGGWVVHNGMIRDHECLIEEHDLHPVTDCDSEILGLLIENNRGGLLDRCCKAVQVVHQQPLTILGLWPRPDRLVAVRKGNPLHFSRTAGGYYLASLADQLPEKVYELQDGTACLFTRKETHHVTI